MTPSPHSAFEFIRAQRIDALNITVEEYTHIKTGAQHIHLASDNNENVFLVALRTVPKDSRGVAHILEHTALCGSKKYPVRDPFFMMTRRSLNTFMNAFTSSDWTAYPFASQNQKDFNNLLDVYLDAVFFATLDPLDFAQEGHRVEFIEPENSDSELVFKGVVFNEMKGAMSSVPSQLWQKLSSHLFPTSTYHYNSGGEPEHIPDLTYAQLQDFYQKHYHPSNAIFMTYGNITAACHQQKFHEQALKNFDKQDLCIQVHPEKRLHSPICIEDAYPLNDAEPGGEKTAGKSHVVIGWLLGDVTNLEASLEAHLLISVLLDNSASVLLNALETTDLGQSPSPLCGLDDSQRELTFVCGLEGCLSENAAAIEAMILDTLTKVAEEGVPQEQVESALHQLELSQREVGGDGYPYGLQLILTALTAATHRGDAFALLDVESALNDLRDKIKQPDFIQTKVRELLLNNTHRVRLALHPDTKMQAHMQAAEKLQLEKIKAALNAAEAQRIIEQTRALNQRQLQVDDDSVLPKVTLADIPKALFYTLGSRETLNDFPLRRYNAGTNGLVYQQLIIKLPSLTEQQQFLLPLYCACLTEVGFGELDYMAVQNLQAQTVGAIHASSSIRGATDNPEDIEGYFILSTKALGHNHQAATKLLQRTLQEAHFNEHARLAELVSQMRSRREQSITGNGHGLAMMAACAGMAPTAQLAHQVGGLAGISTLMKLDDSLSDTQALRQFAQDLSAIHALLQNAPKQFLLVGEQEHLDTYRQHLADLWPQSNVAKEFKVLELPSVNTQMRVGWITNTQVNFCAKAYATVPSEHSDAAALTVLGGVLRNGFLHRAIREQGGAYGAGATQDNNTGTFRFYSYRDPRLSETLEDFDKSIDWLLAEDHNPRAVEEAILGVISSIDKPASPAGEAKQTFQAELFNRTREKRENFRQQILQVTLAEIKQVAQKYLIPSRASIAVVTGSDKQALLKKIGLVEYRL